MAATTPKQIRQRTFKASDKPQLSGQRIYRVVCTDVNDGPEVAIAACPAMGSAWSDEYPNLVVNDIDAKEEGAALSGVVYIVEHSFSTNQTVDKDNGQDAEDPCDRLPTVRLSFDSFEESVYEQKDTAPLAFKADGTPVDISTTWVFNNAICNSTGMAAPISEVFRDPCISISKNVRTTNFASLWILLIEYMNTVNSDAFTINYRGESIEIAAGQAWLADCSSEPGYQNGVQYEAINLTLQVRQEGWRRKIKDEGFKQFKPGEDPTTDASKLVEIKNFDGDPVSEPVFLDGKGRRLEGGDQAVFLSFKTKRSKTFATLFAALN